jgi:alkylation response protein AidB-like acyl-CoA dehydrogenase
MQFDLTDDQRAIQETARDFLAARYKPEEIRRLALDTIDGFTQEGWDAIADLGWPGLLVPEADGGPRPRRVELCVVPGAARLRAGADAVPVHRWPAASCSRGRARTPSASAGSRPLAEGLVRATVACWDAGSAQRSPARLGARAGRRDALGRQGGRDGRGNRRRAARDGRRGPPVGGGPPRAGRRRGARGVPGPTRKLFTVRLDGAPADELTAGDPRAVDLAWHTIVTATAAESVGVAQRCMEMAVRYASERQQFGRPIGAYQAVSHACAQMLLEVEGARSMVLYAAWAIDHEPETAPLAASMAKAYASDAGWRVPASSMQVHGGIGFTWEHDLHFWLKRGKANQFHWGDPRHHRELVAQLAGV